jgi:dynein light intermediate chain
MSERLAGTSFSLLKYDNPVLVREPSDGNKRRVRNFVLCHNKESFVSLAIVLIRLSNFRLQVDELPQLQPASTGLTGGNTSRSIIATTPGPVPDPPSPPGGNKSRDAIRREAQDAINAILPPKEWTEDDQIWRQLVHIQLKKSISI